MGHRVFGVLDILSRVILTDHTQVSAVAASVEPPLPVSTNLRTTLYISLSPGRELPTHEQIETRIRNIVKGLQGLTEGVVQGASNSATQLLDRVSEADFMTAFYRHGWRRFSHYYYKRSQRIPQAISLLEEFQRSSQMQPEHFQHIEDTLAWLEWVDHIIQLGENKGATHAAEFVGEECKRIKGLVDRGDDPPSSLFMAYQSFEAYLESRGNFVPITHWLVKLCSFHIDARRLLALAMSIRSRAVLFGDLHVKTYFQDAPGGQAPVECSKRILLETVMYLKQKYSGKYEMERPGSIFLADDDIVKKLADVLAKDEANYLSPTTCIHCEIFLLCQIQTHGMAILPYIGVSKPSCAPCSIYFDRLENVGFDPVSIRGSHGKVYPGWTFPSVESDKGSEEAERLRKLRTIVTDGLESLLWESIDALRRTARHSGTSVDDLPVSDLMDSERHRKNRSEEELSERSRLLGLRRKTRQRITSLTTDNETGS